MESDNKQSTRAKYIARLRAENKAYEEENEKLGRQQEEFINKIVEMEATIDALREQLSKDKPIEDVIADSINAAREAAKMRGEEVVYCDECDEDLRGLLKVPISSLPIGVASANAGESAVLCRKCHVIMIQKMEEDRDWEAIRSAVIGLTKDHD